MELVAAKLSKISPADQLPQNAHKPAEIEQMPYISFEFLLLSRIFNFFAFLYISRETYFLFLTNFVFHFQVSLATSSYAHKSLSSSLSFPALIQDSITLTHCEYQQIGLVTIYLIYCRKLIEMRSNMFEFN